MGGALARARRSTFGAGTVSAPIESPAWAGLSPFCALGEGVRR